ncbi:AAA family ATPase [Candidatus Woesearchaeota archaeon]|nr:AAA family ATPase [Candidatus Woesearchaeota archaeon]
MPKAKGLFLGKFAPFHKGHEYVVDTALKEVDELTAIVYDCPEIISVPLTVRCSWIKTIYPPVNIIEAWDGPKEVGYTMEIMKKQENYILDLLEGKDITRFYSSEPYGEHMGIALGAENRTIDMARQKVPVSATKIRQDPFKYREFLHPVVYKDLIANIVFMGAPSSGKSTITERMAKEFNTVFMPEYGREYWATHQIERRLTLDQLTEIAKGHIEREDKLLLNANKYLFTDTNAITTYLFSLYYHGKAAPELEAIAEKCIQRYDLFFLCDNDIPYDDTWDRSGDANREVMQKRTIAYLIEHKVPFVVLKGSLEQRVAKVKSILSKFEKYDNLGGLIK